MVASQLNHKIILLLKRPLTHNWSSSLIRTQLESEIIIARLTFDSIFRGTKQFEVFSEGLSNDD